MTSWFDDMADTELLDLLPFFESIASVDNIYTVLRNANSPVNQNHNVVYSPSSDSDEDEILHNQT